MSIVTDPQRSNLLGKRRSKTHGGGERRRMQSQGREGREKRCDEGAVTSRSLRPRKGSDIPKVYLTPTGHDSPDLRRLIPANQLGIPACFVPMPAAECVGIVSSGYLQQGDLQPRQHRKDCFDSKAR